MTVYSTDRDDWRVLTVRQPWAWAIRPGGKTVENRGPVAIGWRAAIGCHLIIRAGKGYDQRGQFHPGTVALAGGVPRPNQREHLPAFRQSVALSVATLADVHSALDETCDCPDLWAELSYPDSTGKLVNPAVHLVLTDIVVLERPVPDHANGRLGLTRPDVPLLADVLNTLGRAGLELANHRQVYG